MYKNFIDQDEESLNIKAAKLMGELSDCAQRTLHERLQYFGYQGHDLQVYLVRLLFCLFADDK